MRTRNFFSAPEKSVSKKNGASGKPGTAAIFFYGTILREYCEHDHSLGYELFKRMGAVMMKRMQAARDKMVDSGQTSLESAAVELSFDG